MSLIAIRTSDGEEIESFSFSESEWNMMKGAPVGTYSMYGYDWPVIPKTSIKGLQFFAAAPGCPHEPSKGESHEHLSAKIALTKAIRALGYHAQPEFSGKTPQGEEWRADVYSNSTQEPTAFEIQFSPQTLDEYKDRSLRYKKANVQSLWFVVDKKFMTLTKAIFQDRYRREGIKLYGYPFLPEIRVVPLLVTSDDNQHLTFSIKVFPENGGAKDITLEQFIEGFFQGRFVLMDNGWKWLSI